jgi:hypothetical protein
VPHASQDAPDFAVPSFSQHDLQFRTARVTAFGAEFCDTRNAFGQMHPGAQLLQRLWSRESEYRGAIGLGNAVPRVSQQVCQFTVVGDDDQSFARTIQTPNGEQPRLTRHQIDDPRTSSGVAVRRNDAGGLVDQIVYVVRSRKRRAVDANLLLRRINTRSQFGHRAAVHLDTPIQNQGLAFAPTGNAGGSQYLLQTLARPG